MSDLQTTRAVKIPDWMTPEQTQAVARGAQQANSDATTLTPEDRRIALDDVVTYAPPAHLTADYDPTYRPMALSRDGQFEVDDDAREVADYNIHAGIWKRCPECGEGIATGLRIHATCEQNRKAGVA